MTMNRSIVLAVAATLSACASGGGSAAKSSSGGGRPAWVEGESPRFPRAQYVLGVGSGDDEGAAGDRARGEISRVFTSAVSVDSSLDETEINLTKGGATNTSFSQIVAQSVRTASQKMLEGVEIVERWRDGASGRHYALAALGKAKAMAAVEEKTRALDADASLWKAKLDLTADKFEKAKAAAKLSTLLKGRLELENERRVLGGGPFPSTVDAAAARAAATKALADLDVVVAVTGDGAEEIETGVVSGLTASGLTAKRGAPGDAGEIVAEASSATQPGEGGDSRWKWSRATATVTLKDGRQGKAFARFDLSERQASADPGEARRRALAGLSKKAADKVAAAISAFFENQ